MKLLLSLLAKPYPFHSGLRRRMGTALLFGGFVWLFLWLYAPFGLSNTGAALPWVSLGYGGITTAVMAALALLLHRLRPPWYREERWTTGHEIGLTMANIFLITLANLLYSAWLGFFPIAGNTFLTILGFTLGVGIFPVALRTLLTQHLAQQRYAGKSAAMNRHLPAEDIANPDHTEAAIPLLALRDDEGTVALRLLPRDLQALEAADNYVKVHYLEDGHLKSTLIRGTLNRFETELRVQDSAFFRVHRSWMVNLRAIEQVDGNARGFQLSLSAMKQAIPVARRRLEDFERVMG